MFLHIDIEYHKYKSRRYSYDLDFKVYKPIFLNKKDPNGIKNRTDLFSLFIKKKYNVNLGKETAT